MKNVLSFIVAVSIPLIIGGLGSIFTQSSVSTWYLELNKPFFNPPNWIFPIAWSYLYITMGIASWLIWKKKTQRNDVKSALILYGVHLFFNLIWSYLFFTLKNPGLALIEIVILLVLIITITFKFYRISKPAAYLFIPYLVWVSFATALNASIVYLN